MDIGLVIGVWVAVGLGCGFARLGRFAGYRRLVLGRSISLVIAVPITERSEPPKRSARLG